MHYPVAPADVRRAIDLLTQLMTAVSGFHRLHELPDSRPLKGTPHGDWWWLNREMQQKQQREEMLVPFNAALTQLREMTPRILDASELPGVRGDGLDLTPLPNLIAQIQGASNGLSAPFHVPMVTQLERLERRLRLASTTERTGTPSRRHRSRQPASEQSLTSKQGQAVQLYGEHKGNYSAAAAAMGVTVATFREHYDTAMRKLGKTAIASPKTQPLRRDQRGQETDEDRRHL